MEMFRITASVCLLLLHFDGGTSDFTYSTVSTRTLQPFSKLPIYTTVHDSDKPVTFRFTLQDTKNETVSQSVKEFSGVGQEVIELSLGDLLDENYNLSVKVTSGDKVVEDMVFLERDKKEGAILIQTDKAIYKPGETVKFRVFLLSRFFRPLNNATTLSVRMYDSNRNVIKSWPSFPISCTMGFNSEMFELSTEPNLGSWSIEAEHPTVRKASLQFSVDQYVLPKYNVKVALSPPFVTYNDSEVTAMVSTTYTFGKSVDAECSVELKEPYSYYVREGRIASVTKSGQTDTDGNMNVLFDVKKELRLESDDVNRWGKSFQFFTSCKDKASGNVKNETTPFTMHQFPYKLEMVDRPQTIRPGFPLNLTIKVSTQDGAPIKDDREDALKIEHGFDYTAEGGVIFRPIPSTGLVVLSFTAPTNPKICYEAIEVTYKGLKESFWLPGKTVSPSRSYLQVQLLTQGEDIKEGSPVRMNVKTSREMKNVNLIVLSRGTIRKSELVPIIKKDKQVAALDNDIEFILPADSSPTAQIFIYITFANGDVVADSVKVDVKAENEVQVEVDQETVEPGGNVSLTFKAAPHIGANQSYFGIRAVDQSVLLLKKDNDLTHSKLTDVANTFLPRPNFYGGSDIFQQFTEAGLAIMTNANLDRGRMNERLPPALPMYSKITAENSAEMDEAPVRVQNMAAAFGGGGSADRVGGGGPSVRVRTSFPETWIFEHVETDQNQITLHKQVPDTVTSWMVSAFEINTQNGLSLSKTPAKVRVFRPFFISLNLPYSVVRGEVLGLQVLVHNYLEKNVNATVTLSVNDAFEVKSQNVNQISIEKDKIATVTIPILLVKHGVVRVEVKALTDEAGDAVVRTLIVNPPGIKHVQNDAVFVNLLSSTKFEAEGLRAVFPKTRVADADSLKVEVVGDILGSSITNLDKLIQLPRGCGEQNMVNFVPNIVILDYLNATGGLTEEIKRKAIRYLERGYQQQLTYLRHDGSYSAFGTSDPVGSTWLTAFVTRSFIQARRYITIDDNLIGRSLRFLTRQQNDNGSFAEEGFVYDKSLQGGVQGELALTAYTLLTFAEAEKAKLLSNNTVLTNGSGFILNTTQRNNETKLDAYAANMISYLFEFLQHDGKEGYFKNVEGLARTTGPGESELYWEQIRKQPKPRNESLIFWRDIDRSTSATVEITSYGLLTYLLKGQEKLDDSVKIVKWLLRRRNAQGGFVSTQDTVVGLTALAKFAEMVKSTQPVDVEVSWKNGSHNFHVTSDNQIDLQEYILPTGVEEVNLKGSSSSKGSALTQLTWSYYVEEVERDPAFTLTTEVKPKDKGRSLTLHLCTTYNSAEKSNMAILEANTPSGYAFDQEELESLRSQGQFKRYELESKDTKLTLYFESFLGGMQKCVDVAAYRLHLVAKLAPGQVKVYDYYDNTQKGEALYEVSGLITLCDICKEEGAGVTCDKIKECSNQKA